MSQTVPRTADWHPKEKRIGIKLVKDNPSWKALTLVVAYRSGYPLMSHPLRDTALPNPTANQ